MDELDLLKKDWNKPSSNTNKVSVKDIYAMLHKKSSSIVKTLFYISIAELIFWTLITILPYFTSGDYQSKLDAILPNNYVLIGLNLFSYGVIFLFIYLLYKAYKSISVTDNVKELMKNILTTRKIIKYYVLCNMVMIFISTIAGLFYSINHDPKMANTFSHFGNDKIFIFAIIILVVIGVVLLIIWLFYKLIYGLLLKRLNRNYNELKKLEV